MARHGENIRKRKDGRWEARLLFGHHASGKRMYKYFYGKTYVEAKEKRTLFLMQQGNQRYFLPDPAMNFGQLLSDWLFCIRPNLKESTYSKYVFAVEKHIVPELGDVRLSHMNSDVIDRFTRDKLERGRLSESGGLSPKTVTDLLSIIKLAVTYGEEKGYLSPGQLRIHHPRRNLPSIQILESKEQKRLERYLLKEWSLPGMGIVLSLYTGLRIGEICALRWEDIHFDTGILCVERTIMRIQDVAYPSKTKVVIDRPKTDSSVRQIPIPDFLLPYLFPCRGTPDSYLLTGTPHYMEPRNYYQRYKKILKKCGMEQYNYHTLRHTFATRCVENGFDIKSLSEILGHADIGTTLRRYVHPSMDLKRQHMERLKKVFICGQPDGQESGKTACFQEK